MTLLQEIVYKLTIKPRLDRLRKLLPEAKIHPAGSRYVCSPPPLFTDVDFLVFAETEVSEGLIAAGYKKTPFTNYGTLQADDFNAWRKGVINLIVTSIHKYAETFHTATHICKARNIKWKIDRVSIHEALRGNVEYIGSDFDPELKSLLEDFNGQHGHAYHKAYRARHGLVL